MDGSGFDDDDESIQLLMEICNKVVKLRLFENLPFILNVSTHDAIQSVKIPSKKWPKFSAMYVQMPTWSTHPLTYSPTHPPKPIPLSLGMNVLIFISLTGSC